MNDVTALMQNYRECVRHIWNSHFRMGDEQPQDWDLRDQFYDAALILFRALVVWRLDVDEPEMLPDYRGDQAPLMFLRLDVEPCSTIMVNRTGAGGYWDDPVSLIETGDLDLRFIQFFDWSDLDFRDFAFYRARIVGSSRHPHLVGRDALLPVTRSVQVFYEGASRSAAPAASGDSTDVSTPGG
jgi:hypothetical protein